MKTSTTFLILIALAIMNNSFAQTTYAVNANSGFSANCTNCTFNIAPGSTLTISHAGTCNNCVFNGGTIDVGHTLTCQSCSFSGNTITMTDQSINTNSTTTTFNNVTLTANGSSSLTANWALSISNSTFIFNGSSYFSNNGGQLDISNSLLDFFGNAYFIANAGPVNLKNGSKLVAGNGLLSSQAYIKMNGPALNIIDNASAIILANYNNYYFNWNAFNSLSNNKTYTTTYPSAASTLNCGKAGQNACGMWSTPNVYGPSGLTATGAASLNALLPVVLTNFSATIAGSEVVLDWSTSAEINAAYFSVERSNNGSDWKRIAVVKMKGNGSAVTRYSYSDAGLLSGASWYRLAMVDIDGQIAYSDVKTVQATFVNEIRFYPNPVIDKVNISFKANPAEMTVKLMSQSGQLLVVRKVAANTTLVSLPVAQYPRGMYVLSVSASNGTEASSKLVIGQ